MSPIDAASLSKRSGSSGIAAIGLCGVTLLGCSPDSPGAQPVPQVHVAPAPPRSSPVQGGPGECAQGMVPRNPNWQGLTVCQGIETPLPDPAPLPTAGSESSGQPAVPMSPPVPYRDEGACPFEGCSYGEWTVNTSVAVRSRPDTEAPVSFVLHKGERVTALTGVVVTLVPGEMRFEDDTRLGTLAMGTTLVRQQDTLYLLTYRGEGCWKGWLRGYVLDDICEFGPSVSFKQPTSTWWVHIERPDGQQGWLDEPARLDKPDY